MPSSAFHFPRRAENQADQGHEVRREYIKLDANPEHQRHAEHAAEDAAATLFCQQPCRRKVRQSVYDEQRDAGEREVLEKHLRERST